MSEQASQKYAFFFRSGYVENGQSVSLGAWRVLTSSMETAQAVSDLYGGVPQLLEKDKVCVNTDAASVDIIVSGRQAIRDCLVTGALKKVHQCDGVQIDRKTYPITRVDFRLADTPNLGIGQYLSTSWALAGEVHQIVKDLSEMQGEALCSLSLEEVDKTLPNGERAHYIKPVLQVKGPAPVRR